MGNVYLSLNFKDGKFFEYSKEEKEEFVKNESQTGKVTYRKYYNKGVTGYLKGIKVRESEYGNELQVIMSVEEDTYYCSFKIYDQRGNIDNTFMKDLIKVLPNMEKGREYTLFPYRFQPKDSEYFKNGVSVKQNGERVDQSIGETFIKADGTVVAEGPIPAIVFQKDKLSGKNRPTAVSLEKRDSVLSDYLSQELDRLTVDNTTSHAASKTEDPAPVQQETTTEAQPTNVETRNPATNTAGVKLPF